MTVRQEYERKSEELLNSFKKRQKAIRREFHDVRKAVSIECTTSSLTTAIALNPYIITQDIKRIETRKDAHILRLMSRHQQVFDEIKNFYRDITHNNLDLIKSLKVNIVIHIVPAHHKGHCTFQIS